MRTSVVFLCLSVVFLLSGCVGAPPATTQPDMTFANFTPIQLDVVAVEILGDYKPPLREPNIEHTFSTPLYVVIENLMKKELIASGSENVLRVIIEDASVVREKLPVTTGFRDVFLVEPSERLNASVLLRFEMVNRLSPDVVLGHAEVSAKRTRTLMEDASLADRDRAYFGMTEDLMCDLNNGLMTVVKNTFGKKM
ncbi:MAG: hypothetical protein KAS59_00925 [Alphaproteobacteria bacterium]|nr:hypothetical protein [Alphaproteobacteria bacterium]MCK5555581.1 hypothetical protein [Alphaproteobacteria bacterium]